MDPGTQVMGFAVVLAQGHSITVLECSALKIKDKKDPLNKLKTIFDETLKIIDAFKTDELAIEAPFYGENVQSMHKLGRAQGVVIAAALYRDMTVAEYSPRKIKQSITGRGSATKQQVAALLNAQYALPPKAAGLDATDALAVAITHLQQQSGKVVGSGISSSWEKFIRLHPEKIKK
ncbi:crossover junction endodeoxyribonuclease RuvC [Schleiferia thermophila]